MTRPAGAPRKPKALRRGSKIGAFAPASPAEHSDFTAGVAELRRLGYDCVSPQLPISVGYFAGTTEDRLESFLEILRDPGLAAFVGVRGGYGSNYLLDADLSTSVGEPRCLIGYSDLTSLQVYIWQKCGWVTFYGPMLAAGFNRGSSVPGGYDESSLLQAVGNSQSGWSLNLCGQSLASGAAEGRLLGGCLTLLQTTLGTPWEVDTRDSILLLEDRGMRPYQVDRALMHLRQAGKFAGVKGIILGEFPNSEPPMAGSPSVRDVCDRILRPLGMPVVFGAPVGHTPRPMLTIPLGIRARLTASAKGALEFLEPAVIE